MKPRCWGGLWQPNTIVPTGDWQTHLRSYFRPLPGIKKLHYWINAIMMTFSLVKKLTLFCTVHQFQNHGPTSATTTFSVLMQIIATSLHGPLINHDILFIKKRSNISCSNNLSWHLCFNDSKIHFRRKKISLVFSDLYFYFFFWGGDILCSMLIVCLS